MHQDENSFLYIIGLVIAITFIALFGIFLICALLSHRKKGEWYGD